MTRSIHACLALLALTAIPSTALAQGDDQAACDAAFSASDVALKDRKLIEARDQLRVCARTLCGSMSSDCSKQLATTEARVPAVVLRAEVAGQTADASVLVDGKPLVGRLDGRSTDVDPGAHTFTFVLTDGRKKDVAFTVSESEKGQKILATFEPRAAGPVVDEPAPVSQPSSRSPLKMVGYVAGAAGIVGLGVGAIFGLRASGKKSDANCDAANLCDAGPLADARSAATVSTIGFVAGGVLLAGGVALVILAPSSASSSSPGSAKGLRVAPSASANGGGLTFVGGF